MFRRAFSLTVRRLNTPTGATPRVVERDLPNPLESKRRMRNGFFVFAAVMGASVFAIVKYEAANSPVVSSTLYTLRRSDKAMDAIGSNIRFASTMPWISGSPGFAISKPEVDFSYEAMGSKGPATVHFHAVRRGSDARFSVLEWELILKDGSKVDLLTEEFVPRIPGKDEDPGMQLA